jgi:hypothetical protein
VYQKEQPCYLGFMAVACQDAEQSPLAPGNTSIGCSTSVVSGSDQGQVATEFQEYGRDLDAGI